MFETLRAMDRAVGLDGDQASLGCVLPQVTSRAGQRACCAQAGNEVGQFASRLGDQLRTGALVMGLPVGWIAVLVGIEELLRLGFGQLAGDVARSIRPFRRVGEGEVGAGGAEAWPCAPARVY